ncbi:extracellular solute-binding protein [Woodsholea maritima]|uniref:extracellular solute-binding protein n=1 Tax=Woodsholea maritima TaxID=240237 RepID=UPI000377B957|nr:extracellular solute-binding protein [Woodsholea maritima]
MSLPRLLTSTTLACGLIAILTACAPRSDQEVGEAVVNVYSARHYSSDAQVYAAFTEETGIQINLVEANGDLLIERVKQDGLRSPADVVITVDAGRLYRAEQAGLFQASDLNGALDQVPATLKHPEGKWFGFATRARVIAYSAERIDPSELHGYEDLADPKYRGRVCMRSSDNVYNQSLLAAMVEKQGEEAAEAWANGVVHNFARPPQGGDSDQISAIAAGQCDLALVNHYYYLRMARSNDGDVKAQADAVTLFFPTSETEHTHVNVSGAGLAAGAPHREAAEIFLQYLLSDKSQRAFAELTNEFPVIETVQYDNPSLAQIADFESEPINVNALGENAGTAQRIFDRVGWP